MLKRNKIILRSTLFVLTVTVLSSCNPFYNGGYKATKEDCLKAKKYLYNGFYEIAPTGKFFGMVGNDSITVGIKPLIGFDKITVIQKSHDDFGRPLANVELNNEATIVFENFTGTNIGKKLAIIANDKLLEAPIINGKISGGMVQISMDSNEEEVDKLVKDIQIISQCTKVKSK